MKIEKERIVKIEFAGYLRIIKEFGNCGEHPQFKHIEIPPDGYKFTEKGKKFSKLKKYQKAILCVLKLFLYLTVII